MSEHERRILEQLATVELSVCPDLEFVTEQDTDPQTWKDIQRTLAEARGEFEPEPPSEGAPQSQPVPRPNVPSRRRPGRHRDADDESILQALDFIDKAVADSGDQVERMERAVEAARARVGQAASSER